MNIIIPMAGQGTRVNGLVPKPLIPLFKNKTMIQLALESLNLDGHYCFITRKYHNYDWNIELYSVLRKTVDTPIIVEIDYLTDGPAISVLHAPSLFFGMKDLLVTNCDQIMKWNSNKFIDFVKTTDALGVVVTYESQTAKNSYARTVKGDSSPCPKFSEVREKEVISKHSLSGIHWYKYGALLPKAVDNMIRAKDSVNGEYYVGPAYNYISGIKRIYPIKPEEHWPVGTQEDIDAYVKKFPN
jgi:NDP-sugar pyrophosphorylase family protein